LIIREVKEKDVKSIFSLFSNSSVRDLNQKSGFYDYPLTPDDIRERSLTGGSLLLEDCGELIAYGIGYRVSDFDKLSHLDEVHKRLNRALGDVFYVDQFCLKSGKPVSLAGQFTHVWYNFAKNNSSSGAISAVPVKPWKNIAALRYNQIHGLVNYCSVEDKGVTLDLFARPFISVGQEFSSDNSFLFGDNVRN
jgi:hypothetical protein